MSNIIVPKVSIAPMVDRTDKYFRYFARLMTRESLLYTEMITTFAILHGDTKRILDFNHFEKPVALQIAGCSPKEIYDAVKIAEGWDYDEVNLNVGCPSDRVAGNEMGAVLMAYPELVEEMVAAMKSATKKPVTVKHRIGIEGKNVLPSSFTRTLLDRYEDMVRFVNTVEKAKPDSYIIHARIAVLEGLSPKDNREIPPIRYEEVYRLKNEFPHLNIIINGGIKNMEDIGKHLEHVDGVMIGRAAYENPYILTQVDKYFPGKEAANLSRREIIEKLIVYIEEMEINGVLANFLLRHTIGLFFNKKGSKQWKQLVSPPYPKNASGRDILMKALEVIPQDVLDEKIVYREI